MSHQPIPQNHILLVLPNIPLVIAPSQMYLVEPSVLLKTLAAKVVDVRATDNPNARVVKPSIRKRQSLLEDLEDTIRSIKAEGKKTKTRCS